MQKKKILVSAMLTLSFAFATNAATRSGDEGVSKYKTVSFENVKVGGELRDRLMRNFNRLEETKYQPDHVFLTEEESGYWPGDTEGRTILGLVMDARATGRTPLYLDEIIRRVPANLNELGYMGTIHRDSVDEQQLSGNGWMLRGLCEYYLWKRDEKLLPVISRMADNLFVGGEKYYESYPISPESRNKGVGAASGSLSQIIGHWRLSTDIGCVFIGMEGMLHALQVTKDEKLRPVADKLVNLFLNVDLTGIKAQTHASLTAMRGLIRYADITGKPEYVNEVEKRWEIYRKQGMTEFYGNYNWFCRYDTWTEPCAIVDAFMVASQLWQHTGKAEYRDDAERIYYNAICLAQRSNGGFGLENSPGKARNSHSVTMNCDEAHWCCTMRGGEGLGRAADYTAFKKDNELAVPFFRSVKVAEKLNAGDVNIEMSTEYPFGNGVSVNVKAAPDKKITLSLEKTSWMKNYVVKVNGKSVKYDDADGLAKVTRRFKAGDKLTVSFEMAPRYEGMVNSENSNPGDFRVMYGPLVLACGVGDDTNVAYGEEFGGSVRESFKGNKSGVVLSPLYHLMSPKVNMAAQPPFSRRIVFTK